MLKLTIMMLFVSMAAQVGAAWLAARVLMSLSRHRLAWLCISVALIGMVYRRFSPLEMALATGLFDFFGALASLVISLLMLFGMIGMGHLFKELEAQRQHLRTLAATDQLTGLHNRRHLFERANEEVQRSQRSGEPLALLMLDLDHFKQVNDQHGHAAGDAVLTAVAAAIRDTTRRVDIAGRIGGEEFAILLPNTDAVAAAVAAERVRQAIEAIPPETGGVSITTSIGVAMAEVIQTSSKADDYFRNLLQEADTALYVAKERGRNRVEFWTPEMAIQAS